MAGVGTVTLLFTDLVGSTAPRAVWATSRSTGFDGRTSPRCAPPSRPTGGDEVKNLGDGLLVAYRSASDAVEGAVAMQRAVDRGTRTRSVDLSIKIGISVGDVTEDDGDWFGMPVERSPRLCAAADGGQILASDVVRLLAGSRARHAMRPAGTRELKGLPEPLAVCVVEWTRGQESLDLPLPPGFVAGREIVGRDAELALVLDIWRAARHGTAATVLVGGEPGIGKTRLAATVAAAAHADGALVLFGRCDEDLAAPVPPVDRGPAVRRARRRPGDDSGLGRRPDPRARAGRARALRAHRRSRAALDRGSGVGAVRVVRGRHCAPHRRGRGEAVAARAR